MNEDLEVPDSMLFENDNVTITGRIFIRNGGRLVFNRCDVVINSSIYIDSGGYLELTECRLALEVSYWRQYDRLLANASTNIVLRGVELNSSGWWTFGYANNYGIVFYGDEFVMANSTVAYSGLQLFLRAAKSVHITNTTFHNQDGVDVNGCPNVTISNCDFRPPLGDVVKWGPEFRDCERLRISDCTFEEYLYYHLYIESCTNVTIASCAVNGNHTKGDNSGIVLIESQHVLLKEVTITRITLSAIHLRMCNTTTIIGCKVMYSHTGLDVVRSINLTLTGCELSRNELAFESHSVMDGTIHLNVFYKNEHDVVDDGGTRWYLDGRGNYWDRYEGPDADGDGIGDVPHPVPNQTEDRYPLVVPPLMDPLRLVRSDPIDGQDSVDPLGPMVLTFNQEVDRDTILYAVSIKPAHTIRLNSVSGWASKWHVTLTFDPALEETTTYTFTVSTDLQDILDRSLDRNYTIIFTTADRTPPVIELVSPENGSLIRPGIPIVFHIDEAFLDSVQIDAGFSQWTYTEDSIVLNTHDWSDGEVELHVLASDTGLNTADARFIFQIDGTAPRISMVSPENGSILGPNGIIEIYVEDASPVSMSVNTSFGNWTSEGMVISVPVVEWPEGNVICILRASDLAGNVMMTPLEYSIDRSPPMLHLIDPGEGSLVTIGTVVSVRVTDASSFVVEHRIFMEEWHDVVVQDDGLALIVIEDGQEGPLPLEVRGRDIVGNENDTVIWYLMDLTAPQIMIEPSREGSIFRPTDIIRVTADDSRLEVLSIYIDGTRVAGGMEGLVILLLVSMDDGTYNLSAIASDSLGLRSEKGLSFVVDGTPPMVHVDRPPYGPYYAPHTELTLNIEDENKGWAQIAIDGGDPIATSETVNSLDLSALSHGWHRLTVEAHDVVDNNVTFEFSFMMDDRAPTIEFPGLYPDQALNPSDGVEVIVSDDLSVETFVRIDDGPWASLGTGLVFILPLNISAGVHRLHVRSADLVGNIGYADIEFRIEEPVSTPDGFPIVPVSMIALLVTISLVVLWMVARRRSGSSGVEQSE